MIANPIGWRGSVLALIWLNVTTMCGATGFAVSPVLLEFPAQERSEVMTITSAVDQRKAFEVEVLRWRQVDGKDILDATEDFLVTPPAFNLAAREVRTLRITRTNASPEADEARYRIVLTEIPLFENHVQRQLNISMKISVPIFVLPIQPLKPNFNLSLSKDGSGDTYAITLTNVGNTHAKVLIAQPLANGMPFRDPLPLPGYALPGNQKVWTLKAEDLKDADQLLVQLPYGVRQTLKIAK